MPAFLGEETVGGTPWLDLFSVPPSQRPQVTGDLTRQRVCDLGHQMWEEIEGAAPQWQEAIRLYLLQLLFTLNRNWQRPPASAFSAPRSNLMRLAPAIDLLHQNPRRRVTSEEAAAACAMSRSRFSLMFHETMGVTFGRFSLRLRTSWAGHLLTATYLGVREIADQCGFADASHFHRSFVECYGCTPAEYRRRFRT